MQQFLRLKAHRDPPTPQVSTVTFGATDDDILLNDHCEGRSVMADLIESLNRVHTKVIVIDINFGPNSCSDEGINDALRRSIRDSYAKVIVTRKTIDPNNVQDGKPLLLAPIMSFSLRVADPQNPDQASIRVTEGLVRFNKNLLKIPLQWFVNDTSTEQRIKEFWMDSLSLVAAQMADPHLMLRPELRQLRDNGDHPFLDVPRYDVPDVGIRDVLCMNVNDSDLKKYHQNLQFDCKSNRLAVSTAVVVIGNRASYDNHDVAGKYLAGFQVHALYIEALLSARYLMEVPDIWWYGTLLVWGLCSQWILHKTQASWFAIGAITISVLILVVSTMILLVAGDFFPPVEGIVSLLLLFVVMILGEMPRKLGDTAEII